MSTVECQNSTYTAAKYFVSNDVIRHSLTNDEAKSSNYTHQKRQRLSPLDDPKWRPYQNDPVLAQMIHELTHPKVATFAELEPHREH